MPALKRRVAEGVDSRLGELLRISRRLHANPDRLAGERFFRVPGR
jgi:hypothetical protein